MEIHKSQQNIGKLTDSERFVSSWSFSVSTGIESINVVIAGKRINFEVTKIQKIPQSKPYGNICPFLVRMACSR